MMGLIHMPQKTSAEQCTLSEISSLSLFKIKPHAGSLTHFDLFMFLLFKLLYIYISWSSLNPLKCQMHLKKYQQEKRNSPLKSSDIYQF